VETCKWPNGSVHELTRSGLCPKPSDPIPTNEHHTPASSPSGAAETKAAQATKKADPTTTPGAVSTQKAPGATTAPATKSSNKPKYTEPVPSAEVSNNSTAPAQKCVDPDTGEPC